MVATAFAVTLAGVSYGAVAATAPRAADLVDAPRGAAGPWLIRGHLRTDPERRADSWSVDLTVTEFRIDGTWQRLPLRLRAAIYDPRDITDWFAGQGFETFVQLRSSRPAANPWVPPAPPLRSMGADARTSLKSFRQLRRRAPTTVSTASRLRSRLRDAARRRFGADAPLALALALGERGQVDAHFRNALARTGMAHLLALSGLHVGIMLGVLLGFLRATGLAAPRAAIPALLALPLLCELVVVRPSIGRATLMAGCLLIGIALGRRTAPLNGLAVATIVLCVVDPWVTRDAGFQFSTAATAAILLTLPDRPQRGPLATAVAVLAVSAAAQLAIEPLVVASSFRLQPFAIGFNLIGVPLTSAVLTTVWIALLADLLAGDFVAAAVGVPARLAIDALQGFAFAADAAFSPIAVAATAVVPVAIVAVALLAVSAPLARRWRRHGLASTVVLLAGAPCLVAVSLAAGNTTPNPEFRFVAFDVGQGDALLVEADNTTTLVDTGGSPGSSYDPGVNLLAPALRARGVRRLDVIAITHMHADHVGGLAGVVSEIPTTEVWVTGVATDPKSPTRLPALPASTVRALSAGYSRRSAACSWEVVHPAADSQETSSWQQSNDSSLVLSIACGNRRLLLTGDSERAAERSYAPQLPAAPSSVLKSPHHGSRTSSTPGLLDAAASRHVVVSVGWRNRFGLPDEDVLERYRSRGMAVYRTDRDGAVTVSLGARIRARGERWTAGRGRRRVGGWLQEP